jgi:hypothetical protein
MKALVVPVAAVLVFACAGSARPQRSAPPVVRYTYILRSQVSGERPITLSETRVGPLPVLPSAPPVSP